MLQNNKNEKKYWNCFNSFQEKGTSISGVFYWIFKTIVALYILDVITNKAAHNCQSEKVIIFIEREIKYYTYTLH